MVAQPQWLRAERSYRTYVRGVRYAFSGLVLTVAFGFLGKASIITGWPLRVVVLLPMSVTFLSVIVGGISWLLVPDKNRANLHQMAFLKMIAHDIFTGIPK
jgi:hypothetical protein